MQHFLCRYEEAFHQVLSLEDVSMVAWLCSQLDPGSLLSQNPPMLNQQLLLPLIQQLGVELFKVIAVCSRLRAAEASLEDCKV